MIIHVRFLLMFHVNLGEPLHGKYRERSRHSKFNFHLCVYCTVFMSGNNGTSVMDNRKIKMLVLQFLKEIISNARGQLVTFRPAKIAQEISSITRRSPRAESVVIRNFFEELVEYKLIQVIKKSARGKVYGIYRNSMLWNLLEHYDVNDVLTIIENIMRSEGSLMPNIMTGLNNTSKLGQGEESSVNERTNVYPETI